MEDITMNSHHQMCLLGSEEDAVVIEKALRTAVLSVVEVINSINRNRLQHYQRKVTEKEKENVQLRAELDKAEKELVLLRQLVSFQQEQCGDESNAGTSTRVLTLDNKLSVETSCGEDGTVNKRQSSVEQSQNVSRKPLSAAEKQKRYRARRDADPERRANYLESEKRRWKRDRELGKRKLIHERSVSEQRVIRRRWRLAKEKSRAAKFEIDILSTQPVSPEYQQPHLQEAGHCVDSQFECLGEETTAAVQDHFDFPASSSEQHALVFSVSGCSENNTDLMSSPVVKQEPPNTDSVYIKFEVKEEKMCAEQDIREPPENSCFSHQKDGAFGTRSRPTYYSAQQTGDIRPSSVSWFKKRNDDRERQRRYRERIRSDPERLQAYLEKDRCRSKRRKPIHELPEQIQKEKRARWREATRRSRARKKSHLAQWTEPL